MTIEELIKEVKENYMEADLDTLEAWNGLLSTEFSWVATQLANVKKERAQREIDIKARLLKEEGKYTEREIERQYFSTQEGQYYAYAGEMLRAISKLISSIRFKIECLKGRI